MSRNIVITGPPHSGKSTLIRELSGFGECVVPEAARQCIDRWKSNNVSVDKSVEDVMGTLWFQENISRKRLEIEDNNDIYNDKRLVLDRSFIDNLAYRRFYGLPEVTGCLYDFNDLSNRYDDVVLLEAIPMQGSDCRKETTEEQLEVGECIRETYSDYGFEIKSENVIGVDAVDNRLKEVLNIVR